MEPVRELTKREKEVAICIAEGLSHKEIAFRLKITTKTVEFHIQAIHEKLGVTGPVGVARYAIRKGWIEA